MTPGDTIEARHIPPPYNSQIYRKEEGFNKLFKIDSLKEAKTEFERLFIESKLKEFNGNISKTAEAINVERSYLHKKIKMYGINVEKYKEGET